MKQNLKDQPVSVRKGDELNLNLLTAYLKEKIPALKGNIQLRQFPSGYSNLTYMLKTGEKEYVLRKPPMGVNIKSAHDMHREFNMLCAIREVYEKVPEPIFYCEDEKVIGTEFYLMERVNGIILRQKAPEGLSLNKHLMENFSMALIDNLVAIHKIDVTQEAFNNIGKPEGYIKRQVEGWVKRYKNAATEEITDMEVAAEWMLGNMPTEGAPSLIHNDYKYDNVVFSAENLSEITAVLDWEMSTVGEPLMDLGTTLAYWADHDTHPALKAFSLTSLQGNLTRQQLAERYALKSGRDISHIVFFYVYASYKVAVICQQIYARYKKGFTKDKRFATLIILVKACAENAVKALKYNRISHFG
ncbi:MAG: phosphotransferase family protein [Bacteroidota bacterium]